jgi:hypothetical protein
LARCAADLLVGGTGARRREDAWNQAYRALEHGFAKGQCSNGRVLAAFPPEVQDFANAFVSMQIKRHAADYDPSARFFKSAVLRDILDAEAVIQRFSTVDIGERRAFAAWVILKTRQ